MANYREFEKKWLKPFLDEVWKGYQDDTYIDGLDIHDIGDGDAQLDAILSDISEHIWEYAEPGNNAEEQRMLAFLLGNFISYAYRNSGRVIKQFVSEIESGASTAANLEGIASSPAANLYKTIRTLSRPDMKSKTVVDIGYRLGKALYGEFAER